MKSLISLMLLTFFVNVSIGSASQSSSSSTLHSTTSTRALDAIDDEYSHDNTTFYVPPPDNILSNDDKATNNVNFTCPTPSQYTVVDGGFPDTRPTMKGNGLPCKFPFTFKGVVYTKCASVYNKDSQPFMTPNNPSELVAPSNGGDPNFWCSLVDVINLDDSSKKMWGYCSCSSTSKPTSNPTTFVPTYRSDPDAVVDPSLQTLTPTGSLLKDRSSAIQFDQNVLFLFGITISSIALFAVFVVLVYYSSTRIPICCRKYICKQSKHDKDDDQNGATGSSSFHSARGTSTAKDLIASPSYANIDAEARPTGRKTLITKQVTRDAEVYEKIEEPEREDDIEKNMKSTKDVNNNLPIKEIVVDVMSQGKDTPRDKRKRSSTAESFQSINRNTISNPAHQPQPQPQIQPPAPKLEPEPKKIALPINPLPRPSTASSSPKKSFAIPTPAQTTSTNTTTSPKKPTLVSTNSSSPRKPSVVSALSSTPKKPTLVSTAPTSNNNNNNNSNQSKPAVTTAKDPRPSTISSSAPSSSFVRSTVVKTEATTTTKSKFPTVVTSPPQSTANKPIQPAESKQTPTTSTPAKPAANNSEPSKTGKRPSLIALQNVASQAKSGIASKLEGILQGNKGGNQNSNNNQPPKSDAPAPKPLSSAATASLASQLAPKAATAGAASSGAAKKAFTEADIAKFTKMRKIGLAEEAIRHAIIRENLDPDEFFSKFPSEQ